MRIEKNEYKLCHDSKQLIKRSAWNLEENILFMMLQDQNLRFF